MGKEIRLYQLIYFTKFSAPTLPNRPFRQGYVRMFHVKHCVWAQDDYAHKWPVNKTFFCNFAFFMREAFRWFRPLTYYLCFAALFNIWKRNNRRRKDGSALLSALPRLFRPANINFFNNCFGLFHVEEPVEPRRLARLNAVCTVGANGRAGKKGRLFRAYNAV